MSEFSGWVPHGIAGDVAGVWQRVFFQVWHHFKLRAMLKGVSQQVIFSGAVLFGVVSQMFFAGSAGLWTLIESVYFFFKSDWGIRPCGVY